MADRDDDFLGAPRRVVRLSRTGRGTVVIAVTVAGARRGIVRLHPGELADVAGGIGAALRGATRAHAPECFVDLEDDSAWPFGPDPSEGDE